MSVAEVSTRETTSLMSCSMVVNGILLLDGLTVLGADGAAVLGADDWLLSQSCGLKSFLVMIQKFRIDKCVWIVRQETGTGNVLAGLVGLNAVGLKKIVGYRSEIVGV